MSLSYRNGSTPSKGEAVFAFRLGQLRRAIEVVDEILVTSPDDRAAIEIAGRAADKSRDWPAAIRYWKRLAVLDPRRSRAFHQLAAALIELGELPQALRVIHYLLEQQPGSAALLRLKLSALLRLGKAERTAAFVAELDRREWGAGDAPYLTSIAGLFLQSGKLALAGEWLDRVDRLSPGSADAVQLRARIAFAERRYDELGELCARLEKAGSPQQQFEAHLLRARAAHNSGAAAAAADFYAEAHRRRPEHEEPAGYLIQHHLARRDVPAAENVLAGIKEGGSLRAARQWWLTLIHDAKGESEQARALLFDGIDRFAGDTRYLTNAANFLIDRGERPEAIRLLEDGLRRDPRSLPLLGRLLQCRMRGDEPPAGVLALCNRILEIDPRHQDAILQQGNSLTRMARRHEALAAYESGTRLFPGNITFWRSAVATSLMLGEEETAKSILKGATEAFAAPTAENYVALADIFDAADAEKEALRMAAAALRLNPELIAAQQIASRLYTSYGYFDRAWPLLLSLQQPADRTIRMVQTYAQVAAGRATARQWTAAGIDDEDSRYPESLFQAIARAGAEGATPDASASGPARDGILHVISTLGAGGSERQLAAAVTGLAPMREIGGQVALAVEDLNPVYGRNFFLPQILHSGIDIHWLDEERLKGRWRDYLAENLDCRPAVQAIASMPVELVKLALPLYCVLMEKRPRVVHLWQDTVCISGGIAAVLAGVPRIVLNTRSTRPVERQRARRYLHAGFLALLSRPGTLLVNNSRAGARDYEAWLGLRAGSVQVVYNGYDFDAVRARIDEPATASKSYPL